MKFPEYTIRCGTAIFPIYVDTLCILYKAGLTQINVSAECQPVLSRLGVVAANGLAMAAGIQIKDPAMRQQLQASARFLKEEDTLLQAEGFAGLASGTDQSLDSITVSKGFYLHTSQAQAGGEGRLDESAAGLEESPDLVAELEAVRQAQESLQMPVSASEGRGMDAESPGLSKSLLAGQPPHQSALQDAGVQDHGHAGSSNRYTLASCARLAYCQFSCGTGNY